MKTFVRCGHLFTGQEDDARAGEILVFDEQGMLDYVGPEKGAPRRARNDHMLDYSAYFVMPGLVDVHTHLAYGNAKSEEDTDLYSPLEFRTLRGMFFAQKVAAAGFTAICSPGDAERRKARPICGHHQPVAPAGRDQRPQLARPPRSGRSDPARPGLEQRLL